MNSIAQNLTQLQANIAKAAQQAGRSTHEVKLIAVSKHQPISALKELIGVGQRHFAESRIQEALPKLASLGHAPLEWHFIGPIQTNKTKAIAQHFGWVHSLGKLDHAVCLSRHRPSHLPPLQVCIQVKLNSIEQRQGVSLDELPELVAKVSCLPKLCLRGLMMLPTKEQSLQADPAPFRRLAELLRQLKPNHPQLDSLSMGMSHDYELAIAEGATMVRIGSALFRGE